MQTTEGSVGSTSQGAAARPDFTLDGLAQRSYATLEALYETSKNPESIRAVDGTPKGRMLAVRLVDETPLGAFVRAFAGSRHFVWDGKTFTSSSDQAGSGINRVQIPGALGKQNLFPFETRFGPSAIDGAPALVLDYDLPENPPWIRKVHDEVREVSPGVFFGPAMWKGAKGRKTVLWFALDTRGRGAEMSEHLFITGTSGAIGSAVARALRARHPRARLTLVNVNEEPSRALATALGGDAGAVRCNLAKSEDAQRVLDDARGRFGPVSGLVNCAGFMEVRRFERIDWARAEALLAVDLVTPLRLMHAVVPEMLVARRGFVVNVASMAGKVTLPGCAFYGAAKAGLSMASEVARAELAPRGVQVVTVYPGAVASALESKARDQYGRSLMTRLVPTGQPDVLARKIIEAIGARRPRVVYPSLYALGLFAAASPIALAFGPDATD